MNFGLWLYVYSRIQLGSSNMIEFGSQILTKPSPDSLFLKWIYFRPTTVINPEGYCTPKLFRKVLFYSFGSTDTKNK